MFLKTKREHYLRSFDFVKWKVICRMHISCHKLLIAVVQLEWELAKQWEMQRFIEIEIAINKMAGKFDHGLKYWHFPFLSSWIYFIELSFCDLSHHRDSAYLLDKSCCWKMLICFDYSHCDNHAFVYKTTTSHCHCFRNLTKMKIFSCTLFTFLFIVN